MVNPLNSVSSSPAGLISDQGHCVVFLGKALYSHSLCLSPPRCIKRTHEVMLGG